MEVTLRLRFHPPVARDLHAIVRWFLDYSGLDISARKLTEIEGAIATLKDTPHKGSLRPDIASVLRAIPAGREAVIAFVVNDETAEVLMFAVTYRDAHLASRNRARCR